jgi:Zn-dependent protease with chaperone function
LLQRLGLNEVPEAYLMQGGGTLNAFATRFLGRDYVVVLSDIVDAMDGHPDGVSFYFGHELGHIRRHHLTGNLLRAPVLWLPLLGAAYSRAKESTCDRHGRACCASPEAAARALVALAAGARRWKQVDLARVRRPGGADARLLDVVPRADQRLSVADQAHRARPRSAAPLPRRNPIAWLLALFVPTPARRAAGSAASWCSSR